MRGKWAAGISPKHFTWVIKGSLAVAERPGGFTVNHRRVRRQEEVIWLAEQGFTKIISLLGTNHNLASYEERHLASATYALPAVGDPTVVLTACFADLAQSLTTKQKVLLHHDELGDKVLGTTAGFLLWSGRVTSGPQAIAVIEHLAARPLGPRGRELVAASMTLPSLSST